MSQDGRRTPAFLHPTTAHGSHLNEAAKSYINTGQAWKDAIIEEKEIILSIDWNDAFVDGLQKKCRFMLEAYNFKDIMVKYTYVYKICFHFVYKSQMNLL